MAFHQRGKKKEKRQHGISSNLLKETKSKHVRKEKKSRLKEMCTKQMVQITIVQIHFKNNIKNPPHVANSAHRHSTSCNESTHT